MSEEKPGDDEGFSTEPVRKRSSVGSTGVIAIHSQRSIFPKTMVALNLAVAIAEEGHRVLAVDLDPEGGLTMSQGLDPDQVERSMFDVLLHSWPLEDVIHPGKVDVAVSSIDLAGAELALSSLIGRERRLQEALLPVRDHYDYILIDTPPWLGLLTINALVAAPGVIVAVHAEYLSLRSLVQLENTVSMIRENLNPQSHLLGLLITDYEERAASSQEAVAILRENFGSSVLETRIPRSAVYQEAERQRQSVLDYRPTAEAAMSYRNLAEEILEAASDRDYESQQH